MISSKLHIAADGAGGREQFHRRRLLPATKTPARLRADVVRVAAPAGWRPARPE